jgi:hypothetical protein
LQISIARLPDIRIILIAPSPSGVDMAQIVSNSLFNIEYIMAKYV